MLRSLAVFATFALSGDLVVAQAAAQDPAMKCEPSLLRPGDTLRVTLPFPHGPYFVVYPPKTRDALTLVEPFATKERPGSVLISGRRFKKMRSIALSVSDAKADIWIFDAVTVKLFRRPGKYRLEVGDQFETEAPLVEGRCDVTLSLSEQPAAQ